MKHGVGGRERKGRREREGGREILGQFKAHDGVRFLDVFGRISFLSLPRISLKDSICIHIRN